MSGGEYQLVRTDSQDEESWENNPPETLSASRTRAVLDRIRALSRLTNSHKYALLSPTRLSGNPQANSSSSSFSSLLTSSTGGPKGKILLLCSFLMGLFVMSTMFWTPWDLLEDVFYVQTFLPSPSTACLLDPSSPSSYVHWNPDSNRNRNVYHCITQRIPDSPSPAFKQSSQSPPSSSSSAVGSALRTWRPLPDACLDAYYTNGSSCSDGQRTQFDIVWTWVNGSDPMIVRAKTEALARLKRLQQQLETPGTDEQAKQDKDSDHESEAVSAHLYR
ncbi:hypothetical protein FS842_000256 [Serendipita sp. 407]|nr:hypothetical protein FS842_000256 [Serendipita sp. 407]